MKFQATGKRPQGRPVGSTIKVKKDNEEGANFVRRKSERGEGLKFKLETYFAINKFSPGTKIKYAANPKSPSSKSFTRYAGYEKAKTIGEALKMGSKKADLFWELERGYYKVLGGVRSEAEEVAAIGQKWFDKVVATLSSMKIAGAAYDLKDPRAEAQILKETAWRAAKMKKCEQLAREMKMKPESADEVAKFECSGDIRLQRRVVDAICAKKLASGKKISQDDVTEVLQLWGFQQNINRLNVMPEGQKYVYSDTIGAIRRRTGQFMCTPATTKYPNFPRLLCKWLLGNEPSLKLNAKFVCTAININANYAGRRHRDNGNEGPSIIRAFGKFTGGHLRYWPKDFKKEGRADVMNLKLKDSVSGDLFKNSFVFDGNRAHEVEAFKGERFTLVFFTGGGWKTMKPEYIEFMKSAGFPFPVPRTLKAIKGCTASLHVKK